MHRRILLSELFEHFLIVTVDRSLSIILKRMKSHHLVEDLGLLWKFLQDVALLVLFWKETENFVCLSDSFIERAFERFID
jgi:hypothetical protein